jgi:hypothetical protein
MNNTLLTSTDLLTVGSTEVFEASVTLNGLLWDLTGANVRLLLVDPNGIVTTLTGTGYLGGAQVSWTVPNTPGNWVRAWDITDVNGYKQTSLQINFSVVRSPI